MIHTSASQSAPFGASWLAEAGAGLDDAGRALLDKAVQCVGDRLAGQSASTGELLADHSAAVACILAKMGADAETRASSLLAVLPEDGRAGSVGADVLRKAFGPDVTALVLGTRALLRLGRLAVNASDSAASGTEQKEMQRKEKQQEKQAKKQQRKQEPGHLQSVEDMTPLDGPVIYSDETDE